MQFRVPHPLLPFVRAAQLWSRAGGLRMSAAMSFYGILSLAPLLIAMVAILGWWLDRETLEQGLVSQIAAMVGQQGGQLIQSALQSAQEPSDGIAASSAGFVVLLFGATGVFAELQNAFERVWTADGEEPPPKPKWWRAAALRLRGVGYILVFGFLLLVSLVVSTLLAMFSGWAGNGLGETLLRVLNELVGLAFGALLFFGLMRLSAGPKPRTRYLLLGAFVGAILFTLGRQALALYLATTAAVSAYGAAGSIIVLLMWIYFSSAVLLFGASCARATEEARAPREAPQSSDRRWAPHRASAATTAAPSMSASPQR